jgi:hypothetical protein
VPSQIRSAIRSSKISSQVVDAPPFDEGEGELFGGRHVAVVLGGHQPEPELLPAETQQVTAGEVVAGDHAAGHVVDRCALHHGVVDVEEGRRRRVRRDAQRRLDLGRRPAGRRFGHRA